VIAIHFRELRDSNPVDWADIGCTEYLSRIGRDREERYGIDVPAGAMDIVLSIGSVIILNPPHGADLGGLRPEFLTF